MPVVGQLALGQARSRLEAFSGRSRLRRVTSPPGAGEDSRLIDDHPAIVQPTDHHSRGDALGACPQGSRPLMGRFATDPSTPVSPTFRPRLQVRPLGETTPSTPSTPGEMCDQCDPRASTTTPAPVIVSYSCHSTHREVIFVFVSCLTCSTGVPLSFRTPSVCVQCM